MIAGVLTAGELALLRTRPQRTELYLAIPSYHTIYTARVNGTPASNDNTVSIAFDGGAGVLTDVEAGMTLLVGSTAGAWDVGLCRIRTSSAGGDTSFYIGITSEIDWADDQFLTVIDDYGLWPRHPYIDAAGTVFMDYNIAYTNQNQYGAPVIIMGSHAVLELTGATVTTNFDATDSYSCIGVPASYTYAWVCSGAVVATPAASDTDITFNAAGTYLVYVTVTADYGGGITASSTAVRYVIVHDTAHPLNKSFALESCSGDYDNGNWSYRVTMNAQATESYVRDRTLCLLVARDWYGTTQSSIGPLVGRENIVCVGWVDGESLRRSNDKSLVSFNIEGPTFWLGVQEGFPTGVDDTDAAPVDWSHIEELDPRKGLFSFLHWRSTATVVMDCYITDDDHRLATTYTPAGSLLEQLRSIAERVNAKAVCDRYGRMFCNIDTQFIVPVSRTFPVVQTMSDRDWREEITIERRTVPQVGQVDLSGVYYSGSLTTSNAIFSLSPGHYPRHYGSKRKVERIALDDQAEANTLAGLWLGYLNNEYPNVDTPMSSNYRAVDIAPRMFVQMSLASGDTPRGITWTNKKLIPRRVSFDFDSGEGLLLTDITFEAETFASDAVIGDPPIEPPAPPPPPVPPAVCNDPAALNYGLVGDCVYPPLSGIVVVITSTSIGRCQDFYTAVPATNTHWDDISTGLPVGCTMYNLAIGGVTGWLIVIDAGSYDLYYCDDLTAVAPNWSLVLTTATARTYPGVWGGHINHSIAATSGGICYLSAQMAAMSTKSYYWRCVAGAVAGFEYVTTPDAVSCNGAGDNQATAACDDGVDVYLSTGNPAAPNCTAWISPTLGTSALCVDGFRGAYAISSGHYVTAGQHMYSLAGVHLLDDANIFTQVSDIGGSTFYIRNSDGFLMIGPAIQAVANDTDGVGVFSAAGATGSGWYAFGEGGGSEILWVAQSVAALNSKRSIAYTADGGATWESRDGDWAAVFGAWDGGLNAMIRTTFV